MATLRSTPRRTRTASLRLLDRTLAPATYAWNPWWAWMQIGVQAAQMAVAAAAVIAQRSALIAAAGATPCARDRREMARMGQEKVDAAFECARRAGTHLFFGSLAAGRQAAWPLADGGAALTRTMMAPFHRRVTANAKRLRRASSRRR